MFYFWNLLLNQLTAVQQLEDVAFSTFVHLLGFCTENTCRAATHAFQLHISRAAFIKHSPAGKSIQVTNICTIFLKYCLQGYFQMVVWDIWILSWLKCFLLNHHLVMVRFYVSRCNLLSSGLFQQTIWSSSLSQDVIERILWGLCYQHSSKVCCHNLNFKANGFRHSLIFDHNLCHNLGLHIELFNTTNISFNRFTLSLS